MITSHGRSEMKKSAKPNTSKKSVSQMLDIEAGSGQQQGGGMGMTGLGAGGSPPGSSDGLTRSNGDTSSVSPIPSAALNGSLRGRSFKGDSSG